MGKLICEAAPRNNGSGFGIPEGGYHHGVSDKNVLALIEGLEKTTHE